MSVCVSVWCDLMGMWMSTIARERGRECMSMRRRKEKKKVEVHLLQTLYLHATFGVVPCHQIFLLNTLCNTQPRSSPSDTSSCYTALSLPCLSTSCISPPPCFTPPCHHPTLCFPPPSCHHALQALPSRPGWRRCRACVSSWTWSPTSTTMPGADCCRWGVSAGRGSKLQCQSYRSAEVW
jgi:hypothetical protein